MTFYEAFLDELEKIATKAFFVGGKRMMTGPGGSLKPFVKKTTIQVPKTPEQKLRKQVATLRARGRDPQIDRPTRMGQAKVPAALKKARLMAQKTGAPMY